MHTSEKRLDAIASFTAPRFAPTIPMPAQFDSFGVRFLYPDNWNVAERGEEEGDQGATLDLPSGGFVSLELTRENEVEGLIDRIVKTISADYDELEREDVVLETLPANTAVTDLRFYYLDLLIISRIVVFRTPDSERDANVLVVQMQAESRDFDKNEPVFDAIMKQIVEAV